MLFKCIDKIAGDHLSGATFDLVSLNKMNKLPIFK